MLDYKTLLNLMTKHFPRWMDIRKRVNTSSGGKYLRSIAEEIENIQDAIEEYKRDFFLVNYLDRYDDIPYYVYYINVGDINEHSFTLLSPSGLDRVETAKEFYNTKNTYLYEDNKLYFKKENVDETSAQVRYIYDDIEYSSIISKLYVWNIYDEFAAFVGLQRYVDENNEELTERILNVFKCIPNSTTDGLKNAIINETLPLINDIYASLSYDEIRDKIIIERPTPENLALKYNEFTTILNKLSDINRDVYRSKTWDFDIWKFELAGIDYIPHVWDYVLSAYTNGVGFKDDLQPEIIIDTESESSATVHLYKQDETTITQYLSGHAIEKDLRFELTQYDNDLSATVVKYTIRASEPIGITSQIDSMYLQINSGNVISNIQLSELIELSDTDILYANNITESFLIYDTTTQECKVKRIHFDDPKITEAIGSSDLSTTSFSFIAPNDYEPIFINVVDGVSNYDITNNHVGSFTYFYITSKSKSVHIAYNSQRTYSKITPDVEIANNFSPILQLNKLLIYSIRGISNCSAYFQDGSIDDYIGSWSFGNSLIEIDTNINYSNVDHNTYLFSGTFSTNSPSIYFEDLFTTDNAHRFISNNNSQIDLENFDICKYEIRSLTDNITITYSNCDKATSELTPSDIDKYVHGVIIENIDNYVKLPHVNIDEILYIGTNKLWTPGDDNTDPYLAPYELIADKGIIVFNTHIESLYIVYKVNVPEYITISTDELYRLVEHNTNAYAKISETQISSITDGYIFDLNSIDSYTEDCNVILSGYASSYIPTIINDTIVFNKVPDNALSIKYGYYYFGDQEYYLLANKTPITDQSIMNTEFTNAHIKNAEVVLNKRSVNYVKNSAMNLDTVSNTYYVDTVRYADLISYNHLGAFSTCDNFYKWHSFGSRLTPYVYDDQLGIQIYPETQNGYAYINITNETDGDYYLSLYVIGNIRAYIARESTYNGLRFHRSINTEFVTELKASGSRLITNYKQEADYDYYLVVTGDGVFDDVILIDSDKVSYMNNKKNLSILGFDINEYVLGSTLSQRLYIDNKHSTSTHADIDDDGYVICSTDIDWGITKLAEYKSGENFYNDIEMRSKVNIDEDHGYLYTLDSVGTIETVPVFIEDTSLIKNLVIEINDMPFENMTGFQTQLLCSQTIDGTYSYIGDIVYNNTGSIPGDTLIGNYIKMHILMPERKIIGSIALYAEYKTTESSQPSGTIYSTASLDSSILDTYHNADYKVDRISFDHDCNLSDFKIYIRAFRDDYVWTDWKEISFDESGKILTDIEFLSSRYFQCRVELLSPKARVSLEYIEITNTNTQ